KVGRRDARPLRQAGRTAATCILTPAPLRSSLSPSHNETASGPYRAPFCGRDSSWSPFLPLPPSPLVLTGALLPRRPSMHACPFFHPLPPHLSLRLDRYPCAFDHRLPLRSQNPGRHRSQACHNPCDHHRNTLSSFP